MAERTTYRAGAGNYAELDETLAAVQADLAEKEEGKGKGDDGRGDAVFDGAPKPVPGDELYDTLFQARAEKSNEAALAARHAAEPDLDTLLAGYAFGRISDSQQHEAEPDIFDRAISEETRGKAAADWQQDNGLISFQALRAEHAAAEPAHFPEAARIEVQQPSQDHQGRASVEAMGMEGPGPERPGSQRAEPDIFDRAISDETREKAAADWAESREQTRTRTMGLSL